MALSFTQFACLLATILFLGSSSVRSEDEKASTNLRGLQSDALPEKSTRIIGGFASEPDRFPYYAVMSGRSLCGAVLISPRFAITAAHCADAAPHLDIGPTSSFGGSAVEIPFQKVLVHPQYDSFTYENDIALFYLQDDAVLPNGDKAPYVKLHPDPILTTGAEMTVIGFGDIDPAEGKTKFSDNLRQVDVKYVPNEECTDDHNGEVTDEMMCAEAPGKDACYGDSGGPLLLTPNEDHLDDAVVGIVSWGRGCANENFPGVYTRISYFYHWITQEMCEQDEKDVPDYIDCQAMPNFNNNQNNNNNKNKDPTLAPTTSPSMAPTASPSSAPSVKSNSEFDTLDLQIAQRFLPGQQRVLQPAVQCHRQDL
eukprot:CAMPEP_0116146244 /NCGR_PEP_ID=MMETSP0329-20121206/17059_1 /TAXON_ID=697910 /ORGANISM="Pseudo-nitzschia arenysensis, Strain B593" /LENGTH=367 /DNA_ID=CAMNT_0003641975 /DNA_START=165 /DNA_END=1267 /DNA_ORIENTATION=-